MLRWITLLLAVAGLSLGVYVVSTARHEAPRAPLAAPPSINPFADGIAASGLVEGLSRNVRVAAVEGGVVVGVDAEVGQRVRAGDPLFRVDARPLEAELLRAAAAHAAAVAELERLRSLPRPEEVSPLEAAVNAAAAELADWEDQWKQTQQAFELAAGSPYEVRRRWFAMQAAREHLARSRAQLDLLKAGAWEQDLRVAQARVAAAEADVRAVELLIDRRTVRSPIDATVLKRNVEPGEFAPASDASPAFVLADLSRLRVRARVDEEDLPGLAPGRRGVARVRGAAELSVPLRMVRIEPLAVSKVDLTGASTERVDTRVVEVIFEVEGEPPVTLYPGQMVDVFIEGPGAAAPRG